MRQTFLGSARVTKLVLRMTDLSAKIVFSDVL